MKTIAIIYKTDTWHTSKSKKVIGVADCQDMAVNMINQYAKEEESEEISSDDSYNLYNIDQTQGYAGEGEFMIEYAQLNTFV